MDKEKETIKAAIYIRVSTEEQANEGYSLEAQEKILRDHCSTKGYEVYGLYADRGISAKDVKGRPEMQRMISDGLHKKFDIVLVWKLTRFTRSLVDLCSVCESLEKSNVYLESHSEGFDSRQPVGRLVRGILGSIAQWEREIIGENVRIAMKARAYKGKRTCSCVLGYDIEKGKDGMAVNEKEAEIVRFVYTTYARSHNMLYVAEQCRERGYCGKRGKQMEPNSVNLILTRPIYAGWYSWQGVPVAKGDFEPIIPVELYNRVQKIIKRTGDSCGRRRHTPLIKLKQETAE